VTHRVRRARYLFLTVTDTPTLDVAAFLRGDVRMGTAGQVVALSVLRGEAFPVADADVELLGSIGAAGWTDAAALDEDMLVASAAKNIPHVPFATMTSPALGNEPHARIVDLI